MKIFPKMSKNELFEKVFGYFSKNMPKPETELQYKDPFQLLVAVILSAQCTDKRVNMITPALFSKFPTPEKMAKASENDIYNLIKSCSYPNNKAHNIHGMANMLIEKFKGIVPDDIETMQELPGVGRKTANVVASVVYNKPTMAVDTHVFRVSARIGLTKNAKNPLETEKQLVANIPDEMMHDAHHWLILHGRYVCKARKPLCTECGINKWCTYKEKTI